MEHHKNELLKFGEMVFGMITDALTVFTPENNAYAYRSVTMRGQNKVHMFVIAGDDLAASVHAHIAQINNVSTLPVANQGRPS